MKCQGKYCGDSKVRRETGKGSFAGWILHVCQRCGQVVHMEKSGAKVR